MNYRSMEPQAYHEPVMLDEVMTWLEPAPGGSYVDVTVGAGGYAAAILEASSPNGTLIGIDRDEEALTLARTRLERFGRRITLVHACFDCIGDAMRTSGVECVDGIVADLGVSSMQLDRCERGFSFREDGPLDMRMDASSGVSAADYIACVDEAELADVIFQFGEERFARRIARAICRERTVRAIVTTCRLAEVVARACVRHGARRKTWSRIHPATRTFQALRIRINDELGMLTRFLEHAPSLLRPGGRLVVVSYHSLEDRLVKRTFRGGAAAMGRTLTSKVVVPSQEEIERNPRARSAKLRVFERTPDSDR